MTDAELYVIIKRTINHGGTKVYLARCVTHIQKLFNEFYNFISDSKYTYDLKYILNSNF